MIEEDLFDPKETTVIYVNQPVVSTTATAEGWSDMTSAVASAKLPAANTPTWDDFGTAHSPQRQELKFAVNDYVFMQPFHVNHDIKPNGNAYVHVHWSTDGVDTTNSVEWEFTIIRALGHDQAAFGSTTVISKEQAVSSTAWQHMVCEVDTGHLKTDY